MLHFSRVFSGYIYVSGLLNRWDEKSQEVYLPGTDESLFYVSAMNIISILPALEQNIYLSYDF